MSDDEIRLRAESLWREAGCPEGRSDEFWRNAESELKAKDEPHRFGHFKIPSEYHIRGNIEIHR